MCACACVYVCVCVCVCVWLAHSGCRRGIVGLARVDERAVVPHHTVNLSVAEETFLLVEQMPRDALLARSVSARSECHIEQACGIIEAKC